MTSEQIEKFLDSKNLLAASLKISFKTRNMLTGVFIKGNDYDDLKQKNFWRIVSGENIEAWHKTKNSNLSKIFSGMEITKLTPA